MKIISYVDALRTSKKEMAVATRGMCSSLLKSYFYKQITFLVDKNGGQSCEWYIVISMEFGYEAVLHFHEVGAIESVQ